METQHVLVRRDRLGEHQLVTAPRGELPPEAAELRIDLFGLTANNATYGALGDSLGYWKFFPTDQPGWGRLPVWGFGTVVRSAAAGVAVGERFYGFFPMSSHLVVSPAQPTEAAFLDGTPHRRALHPIYNQYRRTTHDPSYRADTEPQQVVLRPLFATSFFLADYLREHAYFDAEVTLVTSASSKLAVGMAAVLAGAARDGRALIGLTSARYVAQVAALGLYDRVVAYDDAASLPARPAVLIDIAGNRPVRAAIHRHHGSALRHSLAVGATHGGPGGLGDAPDDLPGPAPVTFFAPAWIQRRSREWTPEGMQRRLGEAWQAFLATVLDSTAGGPPTGSARGWLTIVRSTGAAAIARTYDEVIGGRARPDHGHVLAWASDADAARS